MPVAATHSLIRDEVVVVQAEATSHRITSGEVEHLSRRHPGIGHSQERGDDTEDRVGLAQRTVGQP